MRWTWVASNKDFDFLDLGAINMDVHDDSEADDLWTWDAQVRRGYTAPIATAYRNRWLTYYKGMYRAALPTAAGDFNPPTAADPMCHTYGWGLVRYGVLSNDPAAITEAEAIADIALTRVFGGITSANYPRASFGTGWGGGRNRARPAILVAYLAQATGKAKWTGWLNALIELYMGSPDWQAAPTNGIVQGGAYFCDQAWMNTNGQNAGYSGGARTAYASGDAAWSAGARSNSSYQYSLHGEFLWRAYLITKRTDVRDRLIQFARFIEYYAHDPAHTANGGPFVTSIFGHRAGARWHRDLPGAAHYDASVVNILVWGYKLTGDANLLARAKVHFRQATRWAEGQPGAGAGPLVAENQVSDFIDTRRNVGGSVFFTDNKGQLQFVYQIFENGGRPALEL